MPLSFIAYDTFTNWSEYLGYPTIVLNAYTNVTMNNKIR